VIPMKTAQDTATSQESLPMPERVLRDLVVERAASPSRPQNRSFRSRVCDICGRVDTIRADTKATRCQCLCAACKRHDRSREVERDREEAQGASFQSIDSGDLSTVWRVGSQQQTTRFA